MYNPVSMKIEDPKRLADRELRERKKKARYELKYGVEDDTRIRGMEDYDKDHEYSHHFSLFHFFSFFIQLLLKI